MTDIRNGPAGLDAMRRTTAARLRSLRLERGLRLADVARLTDLSPAHLSRIESADRWPSLPALIALAAAYGVDLSTMLGQRSAPAEVSVHSGDAVWEGDEARGAGVMIANDVTLRYTHESRTQGTEERAEGMGSPEELIGVALAGCFSMSLADRLVQAGATPERIETAAQVQLSVSPDESLITGIRLTCRARAAGLDRAQFEQLADVTRQSCVVARALAAIPVSLDATLIQGLA